MSLSDRQKLVLTLLIHEYVRTAAPVGSQVIVERYKLDMSSATVRNELAALTDMGMLRQPHTSAGRVPTEEGYRYFVSHLIHEMELPDSTTSTITHQFFQMRNDVEQWTRLAASVLSQQSKAASLVTAPHPDRALFKHIELISTRGRQVLMVLVIAGGTIHQRIQVLSEPVYQEQLSAVAARLGNLFQSKDVDDIQSISGQLTGLERDVTGWILEEMNRSDSVVAGEVYLDGLSHIFSEPEFINSEEARRGLHILEERPLLEDFLSQTALNATIGGVQVLIGGEGTRDELSQCSLVVARYGAPGLATGMLGVLGPMRMYYGRSISIVRFISNLLSDLVAENLVDEGFNNKN
jgi:heat-inducible transcriptional repressor